MSNEHKTLIQLKTLLLKLKAQQKDSYHLDLSQTAITADNASEVVRDHKQALEENGLVLISHAISDNSLDEALLAVPQVIKKDFGHLIPAEETSIDPFELDTYRNSKCGRGNAAFGFLFRQPDTWSKADIPQLAVAGESTAFAKSSSYFDCNIQLIAHQENQIAFSLLYALTNREALISADSVKVCSFKTRAKTIGEKKEKYIPTKRKYTVAHIDKYTDELDRHQAMIFGKEEGDVTLCFVRFVHLPKVQKLIATFLGNEAFFTDAAGFFHCDDEKLFSVFRETGIIVCPSPGDLVIWKASVIHVELHRDTLKVEPLKNIKNPLTVRYIVGTHVSDGLERKDLQKLAVLAQEGYVPHPYIQNGPVVEKNNVSRKKTLYKKRAPTKLSEAADIRQTGSLTPHKIKKRFEAFPIRVRHCFGVSESANPSLFSDPAAAAIFESRD